MHWRTGDRVKGAVLVAIATFALTMPFGAFCQQLPKHARIAVLAGVADTAYRDAFGVALRDLGWVEGRNLTIDWRPVPQPEEISVLATDLVGLKPHVIVTAGPRTTRETMKVTTEIPIVFLAVADPEKLRVVQSLPRPGGNVTGLRTIAGEGYGGKLFELLAEAAPKASKIGLLIVDANPGHHSFADQAKSFGSKLGLGVIVLSLRNENDIEPAFVLAKREGVGALVVPGDVLIAANRDRIAALALQYRQPTMFMFSYYADAGGLMTYGVSVSGLYKDAARLADRILRGARPGDIPVEQPTKFDLVINLRTAKQLGLTIPSSLLLRATRVIE